MNKEIHSPDNKHKIDLQYESEIRFGPPYYKLKIDGKKIKRKLWGDTILWSPDSKFVALQEWLTTDYSKGPITRLVLIDIHTKKYSNFRTVEKGFTENYQFTDESIIYEKHYKASGSINKVEVDFENINNWKKLS